MGFMAKREWQIFSGLSVIFLIAYFLPLGNPKVRAGIIEAFRLLQWYARHHTIPCVIPALFIAGAIVSFLSQQSIIRYLGPGANKILAYTVASVSGCILAVCSCSVLPMFAGIYKLGAGIGPACSFLYSGPAINVLAIFLSARVLGIDIGIGRALGAILFAFIVGLFMASMFKKEEEQRFQTPVYMPETGSMAQRPIWKSAVFLALMILFLIFSDWYNPGIARITFKDGKTATFHIRYETEDTLTLQPWSKEGKATGEAKTYYKKEIAKIEPIPSITQTIYDTRWYIAGIIGIAVIVLAFKWYSREDLNQWMFATWDFTKLMVPLLYGGIFVVGFISVFIPEHVVAHLVGNNTLSSNLLASIVGAFFYFATLTEIPITQVLLKFGMAKGPALALLLAGPAVSLPNILVINGVMGTKKTLAFVSIVVIMATISGLIFGAITQ